MTKTTIEREVAVTALTFGRDFEPVPSRIEFEGRTIRFVDEGMRFRISRGNKTTKLFDMTDGESLFRLSQSGLGWKLLSISR